ncbi:MAG TPA: GNAT family N-acetyltransferase [Thermoanaerobaculia bacterium]|jgi:GNAT superfamily N-acetyltransferase
MIRTATPADLPAILELLRDSNDAPYDITLVAEEKCFEPGFAGSPTTRIYGDADGLAVSCGKTLRLLAVRRDRRHQGIGTALLRDARNVSVIAAEAGNYFTPGIVETDTASLAFFRKRGFTEERWTWNLETTLREYPAQDVQRVTDPEPVLAFIEREFGRIWRFEASKNPATLFYTANDGEITGFGGYDLNNRGLAWFGPTGVAKAQRGRGLGRQLLLACLTELWRQGHRKAIIPWTDALEFYRRSCGAEPAHRYVTLSRL